MSHILDMVLMCSCLDEETAWEFSHVMAAANDGHRLSHVSCHVPNNQRRLQTEVFVGAFNYVISPIKAFKHENDVAGVCNAFHAIQWQDREMATLMLCDEHDETVTVFRATDEPFPLPEANHE